MSESWRLTEKEREMRDNAASELPTLQLVDEACRTLAEVIAHTPVAAGKTDRTPADFQHHALWFMGVITFRAVRAAIQAIGAGYEDQAVGYQRLIDETHNRAQKVARDQSGEYARNWLDGKPAGSGAKLAGQEFWEFLSGPVHSNVRAVLDWLAISGADGNTKVVLGPERRPEVSNPMLVYIAGEARDIANLLALSRGLTLNLSELDDKISSAYAEYLPDAPPPSADQSAPSGGSAPVVPSE
jgi:hypothetical protein